MPQSKADPARIAIAWNDPAMVQIGKGGVSEGILEETKRLVKRHKYIKVKLLRSTGANKHTKQAIFEDLCGKVGAELAGIRGNTAVIYKLRK